MVALHGEMPKLAKAAYANAIYSGDASAVSNTMAVGIGRSIGDVHGQWGFQQQGSQGQHRFIQELLESEEAISAIKPTEEKKMAKPKRRIVQVFIADPDERVPLDNALLYRGDQHLTDATDQELFYDLDIKDLLEKHNAFRITVADKSVKERAEMLEPIRARDLQMTVVDVATF